MPASHHCACCQPHSRRRLERQSSEALLPARAHLEKEPLRHLRVRQEGSHPETTAHPPSYIKEGKRRTVSASLRQELCTTSTAVRKSRRGAPPRVKKEAPSRR